MSMAFISHPDCALHYAGPGHPEKPERVEVIQAAVKRYPFKTSIEYYEAPLATHEQLIAVHDEQYVDWVFSIAPNKNRIAIDPDTWMNPHTLQAALRAAGSVPFAVDLIMQKKAQAAFCNVRPPGHHAEREKAMGFCFFDNVAIGVAHALKKYQLQRIAIIDFDVHRGNGTQDIFQNNKKVLYCSSFEHPFYPGYDEDLDNEHILSLPLPAGTDGEVFRQEAQHLWFDKLVQFQPKFIFFSAGFDAHINDPLGNLRFTEADYVWLTTKIAQIAIIHCEGRMVSVLEGGYSLDALAQCVPAHINAMA